MGISNEIKVARIAIDNIIIDLTIIIVKFETKIYATDLRTTRNNVQTVK